MDASTILGLAIGTAIICIGAELSRKIDIEEKDSTISTHYFYDLPNEVRNRINIIAPRKDIISDNPAYNVYSLPKWHSGRI